MVSLFSSIKKIWAVLKTDLIKVGRAFEEDGNGLARLNYALITLIPKEEGARNLKKFRL
jgi:hypothetical protein